MTDGLDPQISHDSSVRLAGLSGKLRPTASHCETCTIRDLAFCSVLHGYELDRLDSISSRYHLDPPQTIVFEGDAADFVYNVTSGVVRLTKMLADGRRQITGFLFPGDFIGMATRQDYAYSAEAVSPIELCRFPRNKLGALLAETPELEHRMLSMAYDELAMAQEQILLLGRKTARERVVSFLLMLSTQAKKRRQPQDKIMLPMSRADIADYLGLTIETVSRTLTRLSKDGLVALPSTHEAILKDRDALSLIATGE